MVDMRRWADGPLVGFDLETTGTDPLVAHIVTAAVVHHLPDDTVAEASRTWLVNPGVPIPEAATAVHGVTTAEAAARGDDPAVAVPSIALELQTAWSDGFPIVIFNAAYDLTLLNVALIRLGSTGLVDRPGWTEALIIDPLVIDRAVDRFRRGKRTLADMTAHYGVSATDAHSADGDAVATCRLARALAARFGDVATADAAALRSQQQVWAKEWSTRFQAFLRSQGRADAVIDGTWPLRLPERGTATVL